MRPTRNVPAVIVGGGPAGCAAAITLARHGWRALVLDRARFPRDKVCGDVLIPSAIETLARLGVDTRELSGLGIVCEGGRYVAPGGRSFAGEFRDRRSRPRPWLIVRRLVFDAWLVSAARAAGAEVMEGTEVTGLVRDEGGAVGGVKARRAAGPGARDRGRELVIGGSCVIGADGASSVVARCLHAHSLPLRHTAVAVRGYARGARLPEPFVEIHTSRRTLPGCAWIVPAGEDVFNVGVGVIRRRGSKPRRAGGAPAPTPARLFDDLRRELPLLASRLEGSDIGELRSWYLPLASGARPLSGPGWLLAGDSAAMIDPLTGHGIHNALEAGRLAGETIAAALARGDVSAEGLRPYETAVRETILREARRGLFVSRLHSSRLFADALAAAGAAGALPVTRSLRRRLLSLIGHSDPRRTILSPWKSAGSLSPGPYRWSRIS